MARSTSVLCRRGSQYLRLTVRHSPTLKVGRSRCRFGLFTKRLIHSPGVLLRRRLQRSANSSRTTSYAAIFLSRARSRRELPFRRRQERRRRTWLTRKGNQMGSKTSRLRALAVAVFSGLLAAAPAYSASSWVYQTPTGSCTYVQSQMGNYAFGGWTDAGTESWYYGSSSCSRTWGRPTNQIRVKVDLYKWNGSSWVACYPATSWSYNPATSTSRYQSVGYVAVCGAGWMAGLATGHVYNGSTWNGGSVFSNSSYWAS